MDADLETMERAALIAEVKRLRAGIRQHRDNSGHDLCWHHPALWLFPPEGPTRYRPCPIGRPSRADASSTASRWTSKRRKHCSRA